MVRDTKDTNIFIALAEPKRRQIIEILASKGQLSATEISEQFDITSAAVSQHLKVLRETEVLIMHKQAQQRLYQINPEALDELEKWIHTIKQAWSSRFNQLDKLLSNKK